MDVLSLGGVAEVGNLQGDEEIVPGTLWLYREWSAWCEMSGSWKSRGCQDQSKVPMAEGPKVILWAWGVLFACPLFIWNSLQEELKWHMESSLFVQILLLVVGILQGQYTNTLIISEIPFSPWPHGLFFTNMFFFKSWKSQRVLVFLCQAVKFLGNGLNCLCTDQKKCNWRQKLYCSYMVFNPILWSGGADLPVWCSWEILFSLFSIHTSDLPGLAFLLWSSFYHSDRINKGRKFGICHGVSVCINAQKWKKPQKLSRDFCILVSRCKI